VNNNQFIPMLHGSMVSTIMDMLADLGAPVIPGLVAARLPKAIADERSGYVPFNRACVWIDREARAQGIDNVGLRAALKAGSSAFAPGVLRPILNSATLYGALHTWAELVRSESSHTSIWLDDSSEDLHLRFNSTFSQDVPGQSDWIWLASVLHLTVVRLFLGDQWLPEKMLVPFYGTGLKTAQELFPTTRLVPHATVTGITIPRALLCAGPKPPSADTAETEMGPDLPRPPATLEESLTDLITSYLPDGVPRVEEAAEISGMTLRTFQRRLAARSLNYKQLVSNVRFEQARTLLEQPDLPVGEVSRQLGYSSPVHFTRAFRNMAGMSPRQYRSKKSGGSLLTHVGG